jgi:hypothetical protein
VRVLVRALDLTCCILASSDLKLLQSSLVFSLVIFKGGGQLLEIILLLDEKLLNFDGKTGLYFKSEAVIIVGRLAFGKAGGRKYS